LSERGDAHRPVIKALSCCSFLIELFNRVKASAAAKAFKATRPSGVSAASHYNTKHFTQEAHRNVLLKSKSFYFNFSLFSINVLAKCVYYLLQFHKF
jgi:hypothetical protein